MFKVCITKWKAYFEQAWAMDSKLSQVKKIVRSKGKLVKDCDNQIWASIKKLW